MAAAESGKWASSAIPSGRLAVGSMLPNRRTTSVRASATAASIVPSIAGRCQRSLRFAGCMALSPHAGRPLPAKRVQLLRVKVQPDAMSPDTTLRDTNRWSQRQPRVWHDAERLGQRSAGCSAPRMRGRRWPMPTRQHLVDGTPVLCRSMHSYVLRGTVRLSADTTNPSGTGLNGSSAVGQSRWRLWNVRRSSMRSSASTM